MALRSNVLALAGVLRLGPSGVPCLSPAMCTPTHTGAS